MSGKNSSGSRRASTPRRILAPWRNVSVRSARFRARRRREPATIPGRQRSQRRDCRGYKTARVGGGVRAASRPRSGYAERFPGFGLRCCGELDRCLPRRQHHARRSLQPTGGRASDARFAACKPADAGVVDHREPASHLGRERSGGMDRPGRIPAAWTLPTCLSTYTLLKEARSD
jgi:hypothetical protein